MLETVERLIRRFPNARNWTDTVFTARLIAAHSGLEELYGPHDPRWWERSQIWGRKDRFSNLAAFAEIVQRVQGGSVDYTVFVPHNGITWGRWRGVIEPETWYVVQGWWKFHPDKLPRGSSFVIRTGERIDSGLLLESHPKKRLRLNGEPFGADHPDEVDLVERLLKYQHAAGVLELW